MTKKVRKFWESISFWNKLRALIILFGSGSEFTLFMLESHPGWKVVAGIATVLGLVISVVIEDKNNNGKVDLFE